MYLLNYLENKEKIKSLYQKQYNVDLSTIVQGYNWYSLVFTDNDEIVAECSVAINECGYFQIDDVEVNTCYRGNGYCQVLVKMVIDNLLVEKISKGVTIISETSTPQNTCYKKVFDMFSDNGHKVVTFEDHQDRQFYRTILF